MKTVFVSERDGLLVAAVYDGNSERVIARSKCASRLMNRLNGYTVVIESGV